MRRRWKRMIQFIFNPILEALFNKTERRKKIYASNLNKPILKNTIFLEAYLGESVTGNALALFEEMYNDPRFSHYKFIWSVRSKDNINPKYKKSKNVKYVIRESRTFLKYLARSEYLITDTTFPAYFNKRRKQKYIMSWHGTPYKTIGKDVIHARKDAHANVMKNILHTDFFISPSNYTSKVILNSQNSKDLFSGEIVEVGMPRVDLSYKIENDVLREKMGLPLDKTIVLYAPTWNDFETNIQKSAYELSRSIEELEELLGSDYIVLLKAHYLEYQAIKEMDTNCYLVDNTIDTNEVLSITDVLITDYSSIFFDFLPLERPIFFYFNNYSEYSEKRGLYLKREELPGDTFESLDKLAMSIRNAPKSLNNKVVSAKAKFAPYDDGEASKRAIEYIFFNQDPNVGEVYKTETNKEKILFYSGYFKKNGITESFIRLTNNFDYDRYCLTVIVPSSVPKNGEIEKTLERLHPKINILYTNNHANLTIFEEYKYKLFLNRGLNGIVKRFSPKKIMVKDYFRVVGNIQFDKVIDFSGYNSHYGARLAFSPVKQKIVFLHSDMKKDKARKVRGRHPNWLPLQLMFSIYHYFDKIVSVSASSHRANVAKLGAKYGISDKMHFVNNYLDTDHIQKLSTQYREISIGTKKYLTEHEKQYSPVIDLKAVEKPSKENVNYVTVGRLSPEKNHELLIKSFKKVLCTQPNSKLYIIGEGATRNELERLIKELDIENEVIMTGHLNNPFFLMKQCDVFVLTSLYEGQALVVLEALTLDLKVVSTDIPGPDNILSQSYGELVEATEIGLSKKMISVADSKKVYKKFNGNKYDKLTIERFMNVIE